MVKPRQVYIQSYDGTAAGATVTADDGTVLTPTSATIWLDANDVNRADLTFILVSVDAKAVVENVTLVCPICEYSEEHKCNPNPTM